MSLLDVIMGMPSLGSANSVLGNDGLSARMGSSPFALNDNPFAGLRPMFPAGPAPMNNENPDPGRSYGGPEMQAPIIDGPMSHSPFERGLDSYLRGVQTVPEMKPMGFESTGPGFGVQSGQPPLRKDPANDNANPVRRIPTGPVFDGLKSLRGKLTDQMGSVDQPTGDQNPQLIEASYKPMPGAYKATGMTQKTWDDMNAQSATAEPAGEQSQSTPVPGAPSPETAQVSPAQTGASMLDVYLDHMFNAESGGNVHAKNPLSSAAGIGQVLKGTALDIMKKHPELGLQPGWQYDTSPKGIANYKAAMRAFTTDNAGYLHNAGIPITPGSLYGAHFLGRGGADAVYHAPDNVPVVSMLDPDQIKANPFLRGMSVGQFKQWAERKMTGKLVSNQRPGTGDASVMEAMTPSIGNGAGGYEGGGNSQGNPIGQDQAPGKGQPMGSVEAKTSAEQAQESPTRSHADRLAMLRQFMQIAGFTPEEMI